MVNIDDVEDLVLNCGACVGGDVAIELITRLRQAEKDAARYRWLRDELTQSQGGIALFDSDSYVCDIDLFIDEATNGSNN